MMTVTEPHVRAPLFDSTLNKVAPPTLSCDSLAGGSFSFRYLARCGLDLDVCGVNRCRGTFVGYRQFLGNGWRRQALGLVLMAGRRTEVTDRTSKGLACVPLSAGQLD